MPSIEEDDRYDTFEDYKSNEYILNNFYIHINEGDIDKFSGTVNTEIEHRFSIIKDCITLKKYLTYFSNIESCNKKNCCRYVNYWLNDRVHKNYKSNESIFTIYNNYMKNDSDINKNNQCASKIKYINRGDFEKIKELYDTYYLFNQFVSNKSYGTSMCFLARNCATSFNKILINYQRAEDIKFCKVLEDFKKKFENDVWISQNKCVNVSPNSLQYLNSCIQLQEQTTGGGLSSEQQEGSLKEKETSVDASDLHKRKETLEIKEEHTTSPTSFGGTLPISLFSSGIGALLIFVTFYKFTPLGHCLQLRTQRFKGISEHLHEEEYEMQQHTSEYDERNSENDEYNISYNSL
ncbi:PIR Superfamily Protein [Plasmodium ovale curtisi]|uniref:PIR Superfamily Protein n=1 Tax=Plasmodium ovale curtisi TaxID=864141 RepID=A0A1A8WLY3_PLAOA|nr:PIR Superfamily Protein [Plasmodium ovale curtisi]